ncbi:MAG: hypothetical protein IJL32_10435 [Oscillospiraceae bacterium]|nr:hypothetical protein [Oscillospiraceae bacterium]
MYHDGQNSSPCDGYAQAYTMLLAAANIESYVISAPGHSWNLVKIGEKYYQTDVTWDDPRVHDINWNWITKTYDTPYSTDYTHFLKSHAEMVSLHDNRYKDLTFDTYLCELHELLNQYTGTRDQIVALALCCTESYSDSNHDGILDYDFDLDGAALQGSDFNEYNGLMQFCFGLIVYSRRRTGINRCASCCIFFSEPFDRHKSP